MKEYTIQTRIREAAYDELSAGEQALVEAARQATWRSYAPYSKFCVGAAVLLDNGEVVTGSNQENVAYPSGTCAERTACYYAHARYPEARFKAIAIAARDTHGEFVEVPISPCGACRQALLEYETLAGAPVPVMLASRSKVLLADSVKTSCLWHSSISNNKKYRHEEFF